MADKDRTEGRARALRLLSAPPLPPLPRREQLGAGSAPRRPGELHEALPLTASQRELVADAALRGGVSPDVAASVLLEAGLAALDLGTGRLDAVDAPAADTAAAALSGAAADYLRSITIARRHRRHAASGVVAIPVRLVPRVASEDRDALFRQVAIEPALAWEAAAVAEGRTLTEWLLRRMLRQSSACSPAAASPPLSSPEKRSS